MVGGEGWKEKETILDFVCQLLKNNERPLHYSVLLEEICLRFPLSEDDDLFKVKAMFYTWLNLDPRFNYAGKGQWGLKKWSSSTGQYHDPALALMHKPSNYGNDLRKQVSGWERLRKDGFPPEKTYYGQDEEIESEAFLNYDED